MQWPQLITTLTEMWIIHFEIKIHTNRGVERLKCLMIIWNDSDISSPSALNFILTLEVLKCARWSRWELPVVCSSISNLLPHRKKNSRAIYALPLNERKPQDSPLFSAISQARNVEKLISCSSDSSLSKGSKMKIPLKFEISARLCAHKKSTHFD